MDGLKALRSTRADLQQSNTTSEHRFEIAAGDPNTHTTECLPISHLFPRSRRPSGSNSKGCISLDSSQATKRVVTGRTGVQPAACLVERAVCLSLSGYPHGGRTVPSYPKILSAEPQPFGSIWCLPMPHRQGQHLPPVHSTWRIRRGNVLRELQARSHAGGERGETAAVVGLPALDISHVAQDCEGCGMYGWFRRIAASPHLHVSISQHAPISTSRRGTGRDVERRGCRR